MSDELKPSDLGLPDKFRSFRPGTKNSLSQEDLISRLIMSDKRFSLICAPPGAGKTVIYMAAAHIMRGVRGRVLIATATRNLQDQLMGDFREMGIKDIRGQANFECLAVRTGGELEGFAAVGTTVDHAPCKHGMTCTMEKKGCLYFDQIRIAERAKYVITNYKFLMNYYRFKDSSTLGKFDVLILDEAHTAPDQLAEFCGIHLTHDDVRSLLDMHLPDLDGDRDNWVEWAGAAGGRCRKRIEDAVDQLNHTSNVLKRALLIRKIEDLSELKYQLKDLSEAHKWSHSDPSTPRTFVPGVQTDWVAETTQTGIQFSPVWAHAYAERWLFNRVPRVLLTSATLQKSAARYLGIPAHDSEFIETGSSFAKDRRPIIYVPTTKVDRHMTEGQKRIWVNKIDSIIDKRLKIKGIIHTYSYDRAKMILENSRHKEILMGHDSKSTRQVVEDYLRADPPAVLVSPSVSEGYDFHGDACRFQIIAKVPFMDTRSLVMKARIKSDKHYQNFMTALKIIQQYGRGMRSEDDWCETIIVDDNFKWFLSIARRGGMIPNWVLRAISTFRGVPPRMREPR